VFLTAGEETRARRVAEREQREWREVLASNRTRHRSDTRRYRDIYGFDLADTSVYDVVLSTDEEAPDALAERLVEQVRARFGDGRRP